MINNILISKDKRKILHRDTRYLGVEGENLQEVLDFNLDEDIVGQGIIEIEFEDGTKGFVEIERTERGYELPVKSSLLTQAGTLKMQLRILQDKQEVFKSEIMDFIVKQAINATETIYTFKELTEDIMLFSGTYETRVQSVPFTSIILTIFLSIFSKS